MTTEIQTPVTPPPEWIPYVIVCALACLVVGVGVAALLERLP
jgi:hypothetical protein